MSIRKYLMDAQANANEGFLGADGFFDDGYNFTANDDFMGADGGNDMMPASAPTSQPYIIQVANTGSAVSSFQILNSFTFINNAGFVNGTLSIGNVNISSAIPNVTYQQMLYQFMNNPYSVGLTYIQSASQNQLLQTISVSTQDANGNLAQKPLVPTIDPYQQQTTVLAMRYGYKIDGFTGLIINQILANTTVTINLYPSDNINLARGLAGRPVSREYGSPGIVRSQPVKLVG